MDYESCLSQHTYPRNQFSSHGISLLDVSNNSIVEGGMSILYDYLFSYLICTERLKLLAIQSFKQFLATGIDFGRISFFSFGSSSCSITFYRFLIEMYKFVF